MKDKINNELQKLQEELTVLESAAKQIRTASEVSETVVNEAKKIHESYTEQLDKILQLYSEYLNKSYRHSEDNVKKVYEYIQEKIKDEESILEKYTQLTIKTEDLTHEYIKKVIEENKATFDSFAKDAKEKIETQQKKIDVYFQDSGKNLNKLLEAHNNEISKVEQLLNSYLELAQATATLTQVLESVDFPKHLDKINKNVENLSTQISNNKDILEKQISENKILIEKQKDSIAKNKEGIDKNNFIASAINKTQGENSAKIQQLLDDKTSETILSKVESQNSKIGTNKLFIIILLIINILGWGGMAFVFFYYFADLLS